MTIKSVWYHRNICFLQVARYKYEIEEVLSIWLWHLYHIITTSGNVALKQRQPTIQSHLLSYRRLEDPKNRKLLVISQFILTYAASSQLCWCCVCAIPGKATKIDAINNSIVNYDKSSSLVIRVNVLNVSAILSGTPYINHS